MKPSAIILSAGASSRMGTPKALLAVPGGTETFLDCLIGRLGVFCDPVIVVLGHEAERIRAGVRREALFVRNERYEDGQLSSLVCGLRAAPAAADWVWFLPVDMPLVEAETFAILAGMCVLKKGQADLVIPRFEGRRGHPVCCSRAVIPEFLALSAGAQARDVIHRNAARTCYVDVDDPGVVRDIDTPAEYAALLPGPLRS